MNNNPEISVIMGIYNCSSTLKQAVDCIINQTYTDWELIMCDDCSSDDTYNIALDIAKTDNRIKVIKNEKNLTLAPTLNKCLDLAKGIYIARMDGDDICKPDRFEKQIKVFNVHPELSVVSSWMALYNNNGVFRIKKYKEFPQPKDLLYGPIFSHAGAMIKKDALLKINGYDCSPKYKRIEDYNLWFRLYKEGYRGCNIQEPLYYMLDDTEALKRRTFINRLNATCFKFKVFKYYNVPFYKYYICLIPLLKYFIPLSLYKFLHKNQKD